jgi:hypothetical protein
MIVTITDQPGRPLQLRPVATKTMGSLSPISLTDPVMIGHEADPTCITDGTCSPKLSSNATP